MKIVQLKGFSEPATIRAIEAIAALWNIRVARDAVEHGAEIDAVVAADQPDPTETGLLERKPFLAYSEHAKAEVTAENRTLCFEGDADVPQSLRRKQLLLAIPDKLAEAKLTDGFHVTARVGSVCVWSTRRGVQRASSHRIGCRAPRLETDQRVCEILNSETFIDTLPLWLFFHALIGPGGWTPPPPRACFIVDDPNLHSVRYGHVSYRRLLEYARSEPFHIAMATIPLDGWWVSTTAAALFRDNPKVLSLLIHGNDHYHLELARDYTHEQRETVVAQSLERTRRLEQRAELRVDRIMAPPYGVCSPQMLELLWQRGFDGVTTNRWSLAKHSPLVSMYPDFGFRPADFVSGGMPIVHRFRFNSPLCANEVALAPIFGKPIVLYGHHKDFADSMTKFREAVRTVNGIPNVRWESMGGIFETNYESHVNQAVFHLRMFSRRVKATLPDGVTQILVDTSNEQSVATNHYILRWSSGTSEGTAIVTRKVPVTIPPGATFELQMATPLESSPQNGRKLPFARTARVIVKRVLTEARDRLRF